MYSQLVRINISVQKPTWQVQLIADDTSFIFEILVLHVGLSGKSFFWTQVKKVLLNSV